MMKCLCMFAALCFLGTVYCLPAAASEHYLFHNGNSDYQIALSAEASPSERFAAEELQRLFAACTGATLPIVSGADADGPTIVLGGAPDDGTLGEQGYRMYTQGQDLVIAGTSAAGTLYGTYDFAREYLGVRWYAPGAEHTPAIDSLPLPQVDKTVTPAFQWRHTSYAWPGKDGAFLARMRDNAGSGDSEHPFGIQHEHDGRCHSYFWYVSPGEFFDTNPEYFSEIGGVRRSHETQLCLTNPDVLDIVTERMLQRMAARPHARQHNFSQMDYYNYCQCAACNAVNERYGTMGGTQFWFLNKLAERTTQVYPDKLIGTLAYMYTEEPPEGLEMHPNIAVWLCHMYPSCDSHPIASCPFDADYKRRAEAWSAITEHLYIWHYVVNFAHYYVPFPNFRALAADLRFYRDIGVEGIYLQGMGHGGGGGEWSLLRPWYIMQLAWNPDQDPDALLRDFLKGYYQDAWEPLYEYIMLLEDQVADEDIHMHLYTNPAQGYLTDDVLAEAARLFDRAETLAADNAELLEAVRVARMPLTYANAFPRNGYRLEEGLLHFNSPIAPIEEMSEFVQRTERHGFTAIRERQGEPDQMLLLGLVFNTALDAPVIENDFLQVDVVPFLGGRVLRVIDRASGETVTGYNITRNLFFPFCGGEETRIGGIFDIEGMFYQFEVTELAADRVVMSTNDGGWEIVRAIALAEDAPVLRIATTVTNTGAAPRETIVRSHTNLDLGPLDTVNVSFTNRMGETIMRDMSPIIAGLREGEHYHDHNAPHGEWRFTGDKNLEVIQRFDDAQLDFAWIYAYPDYLNDLEMEVWATPALLEPGQSTTFAHEIEVRTQ